MNIEEGMKFQNKCSNAFYKVESINFNIKITVILCYLNQFDSCSVSLDLKDLQELNSYDFILLSKFPWEK
jgi:hypothetical protein